MRSEEFRKTLRVLILYGGGDGYSGTVLGLESGALIASAVARPVSPAGLAARRRYAVLRQKSGSCGEKTLFSAAKKDLAFRI